MGMSSEQRAGSGSGTVVGEGQGWGMALLCWSLLLIPILDFP